ncbi:MAG: threonylcarbamoyl-AMP synthase [Planctomycetes bacterium]|nr:threonylcarbamoyl-AMP synthase [Planctomycetota bacterium]
MATEVIKIEAGGDCTDAVRRAVEVLRSGHLVGFPTDTVYGVAARADDAEAMTRLREVKSRSPDKAFTVHIGSPEDATSYVPDLSGVAARFVRKGWPGPLTLILDVEDPSRAPMMSGLNGSAAAAMYYQNTIGLRCPNDPVAQALLQSVDAPIVAASANLADHAPPLTATDVLKELDGRIELLIDTGPTRYSKPSTIVRVRDSQYEIVREGVYDARIVERLSTVVVLLVCTGNTCRSPMAAALAQRELARRLGCSPQDLGRSGVVVNSAGTAGGYGGISDHARRAMADRGMDLSDHQSKALTAEMIQQADYIFVMTRSHRDRMIEMAPDAAHRIALLVQDEDVQDPLGGSQEEYESCAARIEQALHERLQEVTL